MLRLVRIAKAARLVAGILTRSAAADVLRLAGVSAGGHTIDLDVGHVNPRVVLERGAISGSVTATRGHLVAAAAALAAAHLHALARLIARRVPRDRRREAFERRPHDVTVVIEMAPAR